MQERGMWLTMRSEPMGTTLSTPQCADAAICCTEDISTSPGVFTVLVKRSLTKLISPQCLNQREKTMSYRTYSFCLNHLYGVNAFTLTDGSFSTPPELRTTVLLDQDPLNRTITK